MLFRSCSLLRELCAHPDPDNDRRHGFSPLDDSPSVGRYPDVRASEAFGSRSPAALQRHHHWPKVGDRSNEANFETKMSMTSAYTRRGLLGLFAVVSGAALAGCDRKPADAVGVSGAAGPSSPRSEEHTSELQSLMRNSYAVFCLKKK